MGDNFMMCNKCYKPKRILSGGFIKNNIYDIPKEVANHFNRYISTDEGLRIIDIVDRLRNKKLLTITEAGYFIPNKNIFDYLSSQGYFR